MPHTASGAWTRLSVSMLPPEVEPEEKEYVRLLERALAPSFTLVKRLGAGGMGAVYLARDPVLKRLVAVKLLSPGLASDMEARARFEREAQAVASITHPNVVAVYSVGALENGVPYFVMQYVQGRTMAERIAADGPLDAPTAERVLGEMASALASAHRKGVIHRDIKPSNILWEEETGRALLTDFGIAAVKERGEPYSDEKKLTQTGTSLGTPEYMSPEQLLAEPVTEKTDIYSLGLLGYELLIGEGPYKVNSPKEIMAAHLRDTPRRLSTMRGDVEAELERLLESCLAKNPEQRPSAREVEDRLMHGATVLLEWPPPGLERLRDRFRGAVKTLAIGSTLLGVPLVVLTVFERGSWVRELLPRSEFILSLSFIGLVVFLAGCARFAKFFRKAGRAVDGGYRWGTVAEAVADERGDTGALITGAREYATLTPSGRNRLRVMRFARAALLLMASIVPVLGYALGILVAARLESGPSVVLWSSLLLAGLLVGIYGVLDLYEKQLLKAARSRKRPLASVEERPAELAQAWTNSFDQVRRGQWLGAGPAGGRTRVIRVAVSVATFAAIASVLANALLAASIMLGVVSETGMPNFQLMQEKLERVRRLDRYRVEPDSSITPLRAGQALHSISRAGGRGSARNFEGAPAYAIPGYTPPEGPPPFGDSSTIADAFRLARGGFSDRQRRYLRAMSENPTLREFRMAANAPRLDMAAAMWDIPAGANVAFYELPIPAFGGIRNAARSNVAAAALELSAGQTRDAERRIQEVISIGFLMMNDGRTIIEALVGSAIINEARVSYETFLQATGRPSEARFVSSASDPASELPSDNRPRARITLLEMFDSLRTVVHDSTALPAFRWEMLLGVHSLEPCTDLRQLVFGVDSTYRESLGRARAGLMTLPSDSIRFAIAARTLDPGDPIRGGLAVDRSHNWLGRAVTLVTGHPVFEGCGITVGLK